MQDCLAHRSDFKTVVKNCLMFHEWHHAVPQSAYFKVPETLNTFRIVYTSKEPVCPRVELILKIIIILLIIFLGFIKSKPC